MEVQVEGLNEFRRALKQVDGELPKELRRALKREVADPVAGKVKSSVPRLTGQWASVVRGGSTQRSAYIQWGRAKVPYAGWIEFGGRRRGGRNSVAVRPKVPDGRYVYPTIEANAPMAQMAADRALDQTMRRARLTLG